MCVRVGEREGKTRDSERGGKEREEKKGSQRNTGKRGKRGKERILILKGRVGQRSLLRNLDSTDQKD